MQTVFTNKGFESLVDVSIRRYREFKQKEPYYIATSRGKDSVVIKALAEMAGVDFECHNQFTTLDPPELVRFVRKDPDIIIHHPEITAWELFKKKRFPPTRQVRYCCQVLKEGGRRGPSGDPAIPGAQQHRPNNKVSRHKRDGPSGNDGNSVQAFHGSETAPNISINANGCTETGGSQAKTAIKYSFIGGEVPGSQQKSAAAAQYRQAQKEFALRISDFYSDSAGGSGQ